MTSRVTRVCLRLLSRDVMRRRACRHAAPVWAYRALVSWRPATVRNVTRRGALRVRRDAWRHAERCV